MLYPYRSTPRRKAEQKGGVGAGMGRITPLAVQRAIDFTAEDEKVEVGERGHR